MDLTAIISVVIGSCFGFWWRCLRFMAAMRSKALFREGACEGGARLRAC